MPQPRGDVTERQGIASGMTMLNSKMQLEGGHDKLSFQGSPSRKIEAVIEGQHHVRPLRREFFMMCCT